jgi:hypothetical protein
MSAAAIITEAAVFAAGAVAGIVAIVSVGIQREERYFRKTGLVSLTRLAPDRVSKRTRGLVGLSVRQRDDLKPCGTESIHRRPADSIRQLAATTTVLADGQP